MTVKEAAFTHASIYPLRMMIASHKAPHFFVVSDIFQSAPKNKSVPANNTTNNMKVAPLKKWKTLYPSVNPIVHHSLVRCERSFILMSSISSTYDRLILSGALRRLIPSAISLSECVI